MGMNGGKRPGAGKPKGALNKRTVELIDLLEEKGYNPVAELLEFGAHAKAEFNRAKKARDDYEKKKASEGVPISDYDAGRLLSAHAETWMKVAINCASEIIPYMYPKRKAVEHTGANGTPLDLPVMQFYLPVNGRDTGK